MSGPVRAALLAALSFGLSAVLSTTPAWGQKSFPCDSTGACLDTIARRYAAARLLLVAADLPTEADWTAARARVSLPIPEGSTTPAQARIPPAPG